MGSEGKNGFKNLNQIPMYLGHGVGSKNTTENISSQLIQTN